MQQEIDHIMSTVASHATAAVTAAAAAAAEAAEAAKRELHTLIAQRVAALEQEHARRVMELERERDIMRQHAEALERERDVAVGERNAALGVRDQRLSECEAAHLHAAAMEHERDSALRELSELRRHFNLARQDDLLRHALSATVDFGSFDSEVKRQVAVGASGVVLECVVIVPAWCVPEGGATALTAAGAPANRRAVAVAVKVLAGVEDPRHTTLKHRFLREFQALSDMPPHPNVIALLAHFTKRLPKSMYDRLSDGFRLLVGDAANPVLALIMPLHLSTLEAAASVGAEPAQRVQWCLEVAAAMAHMWEYRWVHLDLKLNNVLVASDGRAVLTDMGTAMPVAEDGSLTVPAHMGMHGNPAHHAPEVLSIWEQATRTRDLVAPVRMDAGRQEVWALGVLLHELVAGKHPYGEAYPTEGHDGAPVVDEATLVARGLPAGTVAVVRRMVSRDLGARPANPADAYAELVASVSAVQRRASMDASGSACAGSCPSISQLDAAATAPAPAPVAAVAASASAFEAAAPAAAVAAAAAPTVPASMPAPATVPLLAIQQSFIASQNNLLVDPATGREVANESGRQLQAWRKRHDAAQLCLAFLMLLGSGGVQKNAPQARELAGRSMAWCRGAAEGGEAVAQWLLGECYKLGLGVEQNFAQAVAWYRRAAEQRHAEAQYGLGWCYQNGNGVAEDHVQAAEWYRRAAQQGHVGAQNALWELRQ